MHSKVENPSTDKFVPNSDASPSIYNGFTYTSNVCWTFTCAYAAYLYRVLGIRPKDRFSVAGIGNAPQVPSAWTCSPQQYDAGDGCHCNCGAFDPDCDSMAAVSLDCPNQDDICIPGKNNQPICQLRHVVSLTACCMNEETFLMLSVVL
jgi:hypothetical protein